MIGPDKLAALMADAAADLTAKVGDRTRGDITWQRVEDWTKTPRPDAMTAGPDPDDPDGLRQIEGRRDTDIDDGKLDAAAARYKARLDKATHQIEQGVAELRAIIYATHPDGKARLRSQDLLAARVEADGWCSSCWRDEQHLQPISLRPSGEPYYAGLCRGCGEWKAENGSLPPLDVLRIRHAVGRVRIRA